MSPTGLSTAVCLGLLWGVFWALLALDRPVARLAGWLAIIEGIATAWALGFAVLIGALAF